MKAARAWLKTTGAQLRNQRVAPFAEHSQRIWERLRQESNVELGAMTWPGRTPGGGWSSRSAWTTDNGTALGVMSQGEMHALGLATFLPRGCAPESPFRFVVVDDPVQSMDPAKVDGLARVLAELAEQRQVVVFTHDTRLPDALARLDLGRSRIIEVTRAERGGDPATRLRPGDPLPGRRARPRARRGDRVRGARAGGGGAVPLGDRGGVPPDCVAAAGGPGCAARRHRGGRRGRVPRLTTTVALALFDDAGRGGDVLGYLGRRHGSRAVNAYKACKEGVHGAYLSGLPELVSDVRHLADALRTHAPAVPTPRDGAEVRS
ncbi:hypothetical protein V2I01_38920 [Micromonospora sp. BRA006-A]|nr:hypothetical protein [Micromonospora sp. BRA006-A]